MATTEADKESKPEFHELREGAPLGEVFDFANGLTRERNGKYLSSALSRVLHLGRGGGEMANTILTGEKRLLPIVAAKLMLRIFGVLDILNAKDAFILTLMRKYPEAGCSYCGKKPCQCALDRSRQTASPEPSEAQKAWSVREWQQHMGAVYGPRNDTLDLRDIVLRLESEIGEVEEATLHLIEEQTPPEKLREYEETLIAELTDCFAWLVAICNHHEVKADLEDSFRSRYGNGCPNCGKYPCACEAFTYIDERKDPRNK